jgi:hypothetical protein
MKKIFSAGFLLILCAILLISCEEKIADKDAPGSITFSINADLETSTLKATGGEFDSENSFQLMVSISDMNGNMVFEDELISLFRFSDGFVSAKLEITQNDYYLTKFMVISPEGEVIYASPTTEAPLAYLVNNPLPMFFTISADEVTQLVPEVLVVNENSSEDFGYASFGFQMVKPMTVYMMAINDNPQLMVPTRVMEAQIQVSTENDWSHTFLMDASVNEVILRGGSKYYSILANAEGFDPIKIRVSAEELMASSKENPFLIKFGNMPYAKMMFQPGPEDGKDATITDLNPEKNFGDDLFFEATFKSEPQLAVMRTKNGLVQYNLDNIPKSARIEKVILRLNLMETPEWDSAQYFVDNTEPDFAWFGVVLQQVIEPWDEYEVSWSNQPKTTEVNQVYLNANVWRNSKSVEVDVTSLFVPRQEILLPNYGMMIKQDPSDQFPGLKFASSDHENPEMRPELTVYYSMPLY